MFPSTVSISALSLSSASRLHENLSRQEALVLCFKPFARGFIRENLTLDRCID
jgi:hypothetical protein